MWRIQNSVTFGFGMCLSGMRYKRYCHPRNVMLGSVPPKLPLRRPRPSRAAVTSFWEPVSHRYRGLGGYKPDDSASTAETYSPDRLC